MMTKMRATIKDIAKELKISTSTVSRALADRWDVNSETKKAVLDLAKRWNYKPNPMSKRLQEQHSKLIGVVVPEFINSFFAEVVIGIESILQPEGFNILLMQSNESHTCELNNLNILEGQMVDGIIVSVCHETENSKKYASLQANNYPIVFFNRICTNIVAPHVIIDDYKWAYKAVEHLIKQGARRIAHLAGPDSLIVSKSRKRGYYDALKDYNMPTDEKLIIPCGLKMEEGIMATYKLLEMEDKPDGIFAFNDPIAIGAMKTISKCGYKIPIDISIAGFSQSQMAMIIEPNLTSVEQPTFEMGKVAAELMLEQIRKRNEETISSRTVVLDAIFNIRDSSLKKLKKQQMLK